MLFKYGIFVRQRLVRSHVAMFVAFEILKLLFFENFSFIDFHAFDLDLAHLHGIFV